MRRDIGSLPYGNKLEKALVELNQAVLRTPTGVAVPGADLEPETVIKICRALEIAVSAGPFGPISGVRD